MVGDKKGSPEDLANGMMVDVEYSGSVEETMPARISGARSLSIPASRKNMTRSTDGAFYDLCSLYLKVLDTLWYDNPELNDDIEYISVDLSDAPGSPTAAERSASFEGAKWRSGNGTVSYKNCISDAPEKGAWAEFVIGSRTGS